MNWEQILGLEKPGLKRSQYLGNVSLKQLQNAVIAAKAEVRDLEVSVAGLKATKAAAAAAAIKTNNLFGELLETGESMSKGELFNELKALQRKKASLSAAKSKLELDIRKLTPEKKATKVIEKETKLKKHRVLKAKKKQDITKTKDYKEKKIETLMERLSPENQRYVKSIYDYDTLVETELSIEEGRFPEDIDDYITRKRTELSEIDDTAPVPIWAIDDEERQGTLF